MITLNENNNKKNKTNVLPSEADFLAFQLSILVLGSMVVMPITYAVFASFGLLGDELSALVRDYSYGNLIVLSVATLLPSMIAFGRDLNFDIWRFVVGLGVVAFLALRSYAQLRGSISLPLPLGGGIVGIFVATLTGRIGLAVRNVLQSKRGRRLSLYAIVSVVATIVALGSLGYFLKWTVWNVETAIVLRDTIGVGQFAKGSGEVLSVQLVGSGNQAATVKLQDGDTVVVVSRVIDNGFWCQILSLAPGDRIKFNGSFYSRDRAPEVISADWNRSSFADLKLGSALAMVDARNPCSDYESYNGSIEKLEE